MRVSKRTEREGNVFGSCCLILRCHLSILLIERELFIDNLPTPELTRGNRKSLSHEFARELTSKGSAH